MAQVFGWRARNSFPHKAPPGSIPFTPPFTGPILIIHLMKLALPGTMYPRPYAVLVPPSLIPLRHHSQRQQHYYDLFA